MVPGTTEEEIVFGSGTILDVDPRGSNDDGAALASLGHQIIVCRGPGDAHRCPLVEDGKCAMVGAADGVVFRLDLDDPYHREMLGCYRRELGDTNPMHVVLRAGQEKRHARFLDGFSVSIGEIGPGMRGLSSQVAMASAARVALPEVAWPARAGQMETWED